MENIEECNRPCCCSRKDKVCIVVWSLPFLAQMIHNVKDCQAQVALSATVGPIDDTVLYNRTGTVMNEAGRAATYILDNFPKLLP